MQRALFYGVLTALVALSLGYFGEAWMGWVLFYIGLSVHLGMHYRNFSRLERWSRKPVLDASLEGDGEWDRVFRRLYRHEKESLEKIEQRERDIARLIAAVHAMCELRNTPMPPTKMICYLQRIIRIYRKTLSGENGFIIGRLLIGHPTFENKALPLLEIALAVDKSDGRIIAAELVRSKDCVSKDFASAVKIGVMKNKQVKIGLDDKFLRDLFIQPRIISNHSASRMLKRILGQHIYDVSLSCKPFALIHQNQAFLTQSYSPPDPQEIEVLEAALKGHNARRKAPPPFFG